MAAKAITDQGDSSPRNVDPPRGGLMAQLSKLPTPRTAATSLTPRDHSELYEYHRSPKSSEKR